MNKNIGFIKFIFIVLCSLFFVTCYNPILEDLFKKFDSEKPFVPVYKLGDTGPGGGIIFYVADGLNGRPLGFTLYDINPSKNKTVYYLEAAPEDEVGSTGSIIQWAMSNSPIVGTSKEIGFGRRNTFRVAEMLSAMNELTGTAFDLCINANHGGQIDWFLPNLGELKLMYNYHSNNPIENIIGILYWSSDEVDAGDAWSFNFATGNDWQDWKSSVNNVRAIRAF